MAAALALAVVGLVGTVAYSEMNKTVTLSVDGEVREINTFGGTVEDVLEDQGIEVGKHDAVAPSLDSKVEDGSRVAMRYGRELNLTVDGEDESYWVTATSVDTALDQIGRRFANAELSTSRSAPIGREGLDLAVKTEKAITLVHAGKKSSETTTALTVREALRDLQVDYDDNDEVRPAEQASIDHNSTLRVVDVRKKTRTVEVAIPNDTVVRHNDAMEKGRKKVKREGRDGVRADTYKVVLADGERRTRRKVDSTVEVEPVDRVEVRGTKESSAPDPGSERAPSSSSSGWVAPLSSYDVTGTFGSSGSLWSSTHTGLDLSAPEGTPVGSTAKGRVTFAGYDGSYGYKVAVAHPDGTETWYAHLSSTSVGIGDQVGPGSKVGAVGATGNTTGPHLHLEVRPGGGDPVDPYSALQARGVSL